MIALTINNAHALAEWSKGPIDGTFVLIYASVVLAMLLTTRRR
jgi:hypothetical protein